MGIPAFSAVLLAGGKSTRMGRDKAGVLVEGQMLWERQVATLVATRLHELFISGRADGPYHHKGYEVIADLHPEQGPLGGIEAACWRMQTPLLCVLAVDLPWMTAEFLQRLVMAAGRDGRGVVPQNREYFEPLAAVYPRAMLALVAEHLRGPDHSMQQLIRRAVDLDLVVPYPLDEREQRLFRNVNTADDLEPESASGPPVILTEESGEGIYPGGLAN
jgi:molybdopterin-guanine dinucleotide biosynthesis protein A